jgi:hypothetical protein
VGEGEDPRSEIPLVADEFVQISDDLEEYLSGEVVGF